jgi:hypothetical protein
MRISSCDDYGHSCGCGIGFGWHRIRKLSLYISPVKITNGIDPFVELF